MPKGNGSNPADVRPSPIAGIWYPGNREKLAESIDRFLGEPAMPSRAGELIGLVAPHAGHQYSGAVAGRAFALARNLHPELVVVVSPVHRMAPALVCTSGHGFYKTPLGEIPVDTDAVQQISLALEKLAGFGLYPYRNDQEHSLEIELPFLQRALGEFRLLPIMILDQSARTAQNIGLALAETFAGRKILLVASSDLSHQLPADVAAGLDHEMLRRVEAFDPAAVMRAEEEGVGFACGRAAIAAVLWAAQALGADRVDIVSYANSGDSLDPHIPDRYDAVVGYGAAAIWRAAAA
jgi:AmmeMemoRadiSam system protein B